MLPGMASLAMSYKVLKEKKLGIIPNPHYRSQMKVWLWQVKPYKYSVIPYVRNI